MVTVTCPRPVTDPGSDRSRESPRPVTDPGPVARSYPGLGVTACPKEIRPGGPIFTKVINNAYTLTNMFELFCHNLMLVHLHCSYIDDLLTVIKIKTIIPVGNGL